MARVAVERLVVILEDWLIGVIYMHMYMYMYMYSFLYFANWFETCTFLAMWGNLLHIHYTYCTYTY